MNNQDMLNGIDGPRWYIICKRCLESNFREKSNATRSMCEMWNTAYTQTWMD